MFTRKKPCDNCPFRKGRGSLFGMNPDRLEEIRTASAFQCHKSVDYRGDDPAPGAHPVQCAGLMAVLHREGTPNQITQVAERLGALDPAHLDPDAVAYETWAQVEDAHTKGQEP